MPFGLGFFATAGAGAAGSFDLLETQVLTGSVSSVTFSNINTNYGATYQHLQLRVVVRDDRSGGTGSVLFLRMNGDSGNNYSMHSLAGTGSAMATDATSSVAQISIGDITGGAGTTNAFTPGVIDFLDAFETTKNKTILGFFGQATNYNWISLKGAARYNTAAITSINLYGIGPNLVAGSRFSLYGIKAA
jgi:hypothetical protein